MTEWSLSHTVLVQPLERNMHNGGPLPKKFDVDHDSLRKLEEKMFDMSKEVGPAGNEQWSLDVGCHQDDWHPNALFIGQGPQDYDGEEEELLKGLNYALNRYTKKCEEHKAEAEHLKASIPRLPHPKPVPIQHKGKGKSNGQR
uniref:Uncharacterized protein n=1 Tax=Moniliophthora roreri TaxID=221103 RepID=A0A0W0G3V3_MONRR